MLTDGDIKWMRDREKRRKKEAAAAARKAAEVVRNAVEEREEKERPKRLRQAQQRRYYARHPEKCAAMTRAWLEKNPDYKKQEGRDRYMLDAEYFKARSRAYYAANRKRINATRRAKRRNLGQANDDDSTGAGGDGGPTLD